MALPASLFQRTFAAVPTTTVVTSAFPQSALAALQGILPAAAAAVLPPPIPTLFGALAVPPLLAGGLFGLPIPTVIPMVNPLAAFLPAIVGAIPPTVFMQTFVSVPVSTIAVSPAAVPGVI